jgi:hypothetical protein
MKFPQFRLSDLFRPFVSTASDFFAGWQAFWFNPASPTTLGVIRVLTGFVLLYILIVTSPLLPVIYSDDALLDRETMNIMRRETPWMPPSNQWEREDTEQPQQPRIERPELIGAPGNPAYTARWNVSPEFTIDEGLTIFSPYFHFGNPTWLFVCNALGIVVAVLFTLGLFTRVMAVLAWFIAMSTVHRSLPALFGMDTMLAILLLYLMLGPAGDAFSLDSLLRRRRLIKDALENHKPLPDLAPQPTVGANIVLRLLQIHFCIMYFAAGTSKLQGPAWWNGTAIWQTLSNYEFTPRPWFMTELLRQTTYSRAVWETLFFGGAFATILLEISLPFLIWQKGWRWLMILGAVLLHTSIAITMGLTAFSMLMILIVGSFIPPEVTQTVLRWLFATKTRISLFFRSKPEVGIELATFAKTADVFDQIKLVDVSAPPREDAEAVAIPETLTEPQLATEDGRIISGSACWSHITRTLLILWPMRLFIGSGQEKNQPASV